MEPSIAPAQYAKNCVAVRPRDNLDGFKGRAARLAGALKMRWSNREGAYIASRAKARKLMALFRAGWDASIFGGLLPCESQSYTEAVETARAIGVPRSRIDT